MIKSVSDYLEKSASLLGDKLAYIDENKALTFAELKDESLHVAQGLIEAVGMGSPVVVFMEKSVDSIVGFLGVSYLNAFYVPIDTAMPYNRVKLILDTLEAKVILTRHQDAVPEEFLNGLYKVYYLEDLLAVPLNETTINSIGLIQRKRIDTDPIYAIFTSGSTGIPKGVLISQRSAVNFTEWWCETFEFDSDEVFANQTPFYFDASVKDIYATLRCGATMYIVPRKLFSLPAKLVEFLNENRVTCIDWVPSVLCMIANFRTLEKAKPEYLKKIMFLGEVMPTKQFNIWRRALPLVKFANLYGPTEATGDCTYYKIEREFEDTESIPIGYPCENTDVILLNEKNQPVSGEEVGELCVRGCSLALGYFNNPEKTDEVFIQNPMQNMYKERIYRTGDLAKYNEYGEIIFMSRKDSQIKHMGHRIELGEIENALSSVDEIRRACCLYDNESQKIVAVYEGEMESKEIVNALKEFVPRYMIPNVYHKIEEMPINLNGKIDRVFLRKEYIGD